MERNFLNGHLICNFFPKLEPPTGISKKNHETSFWCLFCRYGVIAYLVQYFKVHMLVTDRVPEIWVSGFGSAIEKWV